MKRKSSQSPHPPTLHTVIIGDVKSMWEKMYWDVDQFSDIQTSYPKKNENEALVYAALNACVSAWSLEQWVETFWKKRLRAQKKKFRNNELRWLISQRIPIQSLCADVANTYKHADYRENRQTTGQLILQWDEGDEDVPPGLMLLKSQGERHTLFHSDLHNLPRDWWHLLCELDLVSGDQPTPEWLRIKLGRIFGSAVGKIGPPNP